jgi:hypothetical protein
VLRELWAAKHAQASPEGQGDLICGADWATFVMPRKLHGNRLDCSIVIGVLGFGLFLGLFNRSASSLVRWRPFLFRFRFHGNVFFKARQWQ